MKNDDTLSVLLLEDEALIAFDLEDHLRDAGFQIAGILSSCAEALAWLEANKPDIVVLDVRLSDGVCEEVVRLVRRREIPFIVHSGNSYDPAIHDVAFLDGDWVLKPCPPDVLVAAVTSSMSKARLEAIARQVQDSA